MPGFSSAASSKLDPEQPESGRLARRWRAAHRTSDGAAFDRPGRFRQTSLGMVALLSIPILILDARLLGWPLLNEPFSLLLAIPVAGEAAAALLVASLLLNWAYFHERPLLAHLPSSGARRLLGRVALLLPVLSWTYAACLGPRDLSSERELTTRTDRRPRWLLALQLDRRVWVARLTLELVTLHAAALWLEDLVGRSIVLPVALLTVALRGAMMIHWRHYLEDLGSGSGLEPIAPPWRHRIALATWLPMPLPLATLALVLHRETRGDLAMVAYVDQRRRWIGLFEGASDPRMAVPVMTPRRRRSMMGSYRRLQRVRLIAEGTVLGWLLSGAFVGEVATAADPTWGRALWVLGGVVAVLLGALGLLDVSARMARPRLPLERLSSHLELGSRVACLSFGAVLGRLVGVGHADLVVEALMVTASIGFAVHCPVQLWLVFRRPSGGGLRAALLWLALVGTWFLIVLSSELAPALTASATAEAVWDDITPMAARVWLPVAGFVALAMPIVSLAFVGWHLKPWRARDLFDAATPPAARRTIVVAISVAVVPLAGLLAPLAVSPLDRSR